MCYDGDVDQGSPQLKSSGMTAKSTPVSLPTQSNILVRSPAGEYAESCFHSTTGPGVRKVAADPTEWEKEFAVFLRQKKMSRTSNSDSGVSTSTEYEVEEDSDIDSKAMDCEGPSERKKCPTNRNDCARRSSDAHNVYLFPQASPSRKMTETTGVRSSRRLSGLSRSKSAILSGVYSDRKTALMQQFSQAWS